MFAHFKWLSVKNILQNIKELALRFPLVSLVTLLGSICACILVDSSSYGFAPETLHILNKVLLMCVLGFPLLTALTLVSEHFKWNKSYHFLVQALGLASLVLYYFLLPKDPNDFGVVQITRMIIFNIVAYLFALSFPFYKKGESIRFWRFTENAFARAIVAGFFSLTLWAGIALSLAAIDYLFGVNIKGEVYLRIWVLIIGIFGTWFFLAGFPPLHEHLPETAENSRILHIFIQYICVPLLCIFFVILYVYLGKIVVTGVWPKGGVADWILGFSSAGFLVYVLSYPLLEKSGHPFLKKFFQVFFALVLPMVVVLFIAIGIRVNAYGVTESRYLVALGGIWLTLNSLYFLLSKQKSLTLLPYLAAGFLFFSSSGPWGMYFLSIRSQHARLEELLVKNHLLVDGKIQAVGDEKTILIEDRASMYSKMQFLVEHKRKDLLEMWFPNIKSSSTVEYNDYLFVEDALASMNIHEFYNNLYPVDENYAYLSSAVSVIQVTNFDNLFGTIYLHQTLGGVLDTQFAVSSSSFEFSLEKNMVHVFENKVEILSVDVGPSLSRWKEQYENAPPKRISNVGAPMMIDAPGKKQSFRFLFDNLSLRKENNEWVIESGDMRVLVDFK